MPVDPQSIAFKEAAIRHNVKVYEELSVETKLILQTKESRDQDSLQLYSKMQHQAQIIIRHCDRVKSDYETIIKDLPDWIEKTKQHYQPLASYWQKLSDAKITYDGQSDGYDSKQMEAIEKFQFSLNTAKAIYKKLVNELRTKAKKLTPAQLKIKYQTLQTQAKLIADEYSQFNATNPHFTTAELQLKQQQFVKLSRFWRLIELESIPYHNQEVFFLDSEDEDKFIKDEQLRVIAAQEQKYQELFTKLTNNLIRHELKEKEIKKLYQQLSFLAHKNEQCYAKIPTILQTEEIIAQQTRQQKLCTFWDLVIAKKIDYYEPRQLDYFLITENSDFFLTNIQPIFNLTNTYQQLVLPLMDEIYYNIDDILQDKYRAIINILTTIQKYQAPEDLPDAIKAIIKTYGKHLRFWELILQGYIVYHGQELDFEEYDDEAEFIRTDLLETIAILEKKYQAQTTALKINSPQLSQSECIIKYQDLKCIVTQITNLYASLIKNNPTELYTSNLERFSKLINFWELAIADTSNPDVSDVLIIYVDDFYYRGRQQEELFLHATTKEQFFELDDIEYNLETAIRDYETKIDSYRKNLKTIQATKSEEQASLHVSIITQITTILKAYAEVPVNFRTEYHNQIAQRFEHLNKFWQLIQTRRMSYHQQEEFFLLATDDKTIDELAELDNELFTLQKNYQILITEFEQSTTPTAIAHSEQLALIQSTLTQILAIYQHINEIAVSAAINIPASIRQDHIEYKLQKKYWLKLQEDRLPYKKLPSQSTSFITKLQFWKSTPAASTTTEDINLTRDEFIAIERWKLETQYEQLKEQYQSQHETLIKSLENPDRFSRILQFKKMLETSTQLMQTFTKCHAQLPSYLKHEKINIHRLQLFWQLVAGGKLTYKAQEQEFVEDLRRLDLAMAIFITSTHKFRTHLTQTKLTTKEITAQKQELKSLAEDISAACQTFARNQGILPEHLKNTENAFGNLAIFWDQVIANVIEYTPPQSEEESQENRFSRRETWLKNILPLFNSKETTPEQQNLAKVTLHKFWDLTYQYLQIKLSEQYAALWSQGSTATSIIPLAIQTATQQIGTSKYLSMIIDTLLSPTGFQPGASISTALQSVCNSKNAPTITTDLLSSWLGFRHGNHMFKQLKQTPDILEQQTFKNLIQHLGSSEKALTYIQKSITNLEAKIVTEQEYGFIIKGICNTLFNFASLNIVNSWWQQSLVSCLRLPLVHLASPYFTSYTDSAHPMEQFTQTYYHEKTKATHNAYTKLLESSIPTIPLIKISI